MRDFYQRRIHSRFELETPILFAKWDSDELVSAKMLNISDAGMYFESGKDVGPSSEVCIWLENIPRIETREVRIYEFYRSKVRWRRELENADGLGVGVQHVSRTMGVQLPDFHCSLCEKKIPLGRVRFVKDFLYFCPACHAEIESRHEAGRDEMLRMLEGNVF